MAQRPKKDQEANTRRIEKELIKLPSKVSKRGTDYEYVMCTTTYQVPFNFKSGDWETDRTKWKEINFVEEDFPNADKERLLSGYIGQKTELQKKIDEIQVYIDKLNNEE